MLFRRYSSQARREVRLIVEDDEAKVGWGRLEWWDEADGTRLYLLSGGVAVPRRRQGIGRALLARLEEEAAALWRADPGPGAALLGANAGPEEPETLALLTAAGYQNTTQENPNGAVALYESLGYPETGRTPRYAKPLSNDQAGGKSG